MSTTTTTTATGASTQLAPAGASRDLRPWFVYARKSRIGVGATITKENQFGACTDYVHGYAGPDVPIVYFFDNASGFDETARRDDWETMLAAIRNGEAAGVVAWHVDRFTRIPEVGEHLWKACKANGTQLHTKLGGHQTSALAFRVQNAVAADESEIKSERQKLKHAQLAADGLPHGGRRAYGWNKYRTELVPDEAENVRWVADQILAGRSIRSITAELNAPVGEKDGKPYGRGAATVSGAPWRPGNLSTYMRRAALAAKRVHGKDAHGRPIIVGDAKWPAILPLGKWQAVRTLLENPERRVAKSAPRVYLLSGIASCGVCGSPMRGRSNATKGLPAAYFCEASNGHAYRRADLVDAQVRAVVVARLAEIDASGAVLPAVDDSRAAVVAESIRELEGRQSALIPMYLAGEITQAQLTAGTADAEQKLAKLRLELDLLEVEKARPVAVLEGLAGMVNAAELFDAMDLEGRRAVVRELVTVTIQPQGRDGRSGRTYRPELVEVVPRG